MTTICYKSKWIWSMLAFGIAYLFIGLYAMFVSQANYGLSAFAAFGLVYIGMFLFRLKKQLAVFTDSEIILHGLPSKKIAYSDLTFAGKSVGDFSFKSAKKEIRFDAKLVAGDSKKFLEEFIANRAKNAA